MNILVRTLIILLAAVVVVGAAYGVTQVPAVQTLLSSQGGEHGPPGGMSEDAAAGGGMMFGGVEAEFAADTAGTTAAEPAAQARPQRGEGGHSSGNLVGLVAVGRNLGIVIVFSMAIAAASFASRRIRPQRRTRAAVV